MLAQNGSKAGDALADPKVVMPWWMGAVGAPAFLTAMIVPIRESLASLLQVIIGGVIRRFVKRKYFWVFAALIQGLAVLAMAAVAHAGLEGHAAEWVIIALVTLFSLARGVPPSLGRTRSARRLIRVGAGVWVAMQPARQA